MRPRTMRTARMRSPAAPTIRTWRLVGVSEAPRPPARAGRNSDCRATTRRAGARCLRVASEPISAWASFSTEGRTTARSVRPACRPAHAASPVLVATGRRVRRGTSARAHSARVSPGSASDASFRDDGRPRVFRRVWMPSRSRAPRRGDARCCWDGRVHSGRGGRMSGAAPADHGSLVQQRERAPRVFRVDSHAAPARMDSGLGL